jgi:acyl-CoA synthetase (AMP-forming)/AMP-acid ligase II
MIMYFSSLLFSSSRRRGWRSRPNPAGIGAGPRGAARANALANDKIPRTMEIVTVLPRGDNGKIAKRHLREAYWQNESRRI